MQMQTHTLRDLFIEELRDIYDAEQRLTKALPKMAKAASSEELAAMFENHLTETQEHVARLEQVLESLDESPTRKTCKAMVGLLEEGEDLMNRQAPPSVKDAALIAAAQKVEHYEIATYGCLRTWAEQLNESEASELLQETLDEEGAADSALTDVARSLDADEMDEDEDDEIDAVVTPERIASGGSRISQKPRKH